MLNEISTAGQKAIAMNSSALPRPKTRQNVNLKVKTVDRQPKINHLYHDFVIVATTIECSPGSASEHSVLVNNSG